MIYKDRGFGGDNQAVTDSIYNLGSNNFGWNDKMGSVKSYRGTWKLYKDTQMKGDSMVVCDGQQYDRVVHDDSYSSIELVNNDSCGMYSINIPISHFNLMRDLLFIFTETLQQEISLMMFG